MDEYKEHFYRSRGGKPSMEIGDLSERLQLRSRLQCHDFGWYLKNISPDLRVPDSKAVAFGAISNGNCWFCSMLCDASDGRVFTTKKWVKKLVRSQKKKSHFSVGH
jgi:hypothetical protein